MFFHILFYLFISWGMRDCIYIAKHCESFLKTLAVWVHEADLNIGVCQAHVILILVFFSSRAAAWWAVINLVDMLFSYYEHQWALLMLFNHLKIENCTCLHYYDVDPWIIDFVEKLNWTELTYTYNQKDWWIRNSKWMNLSCIYFN